MEILIFIFYLILFIFLIPKIPFFKNAGLEKSTLIALFLIKIFAGIAYARFYTLPKYYPGSDTFRFYRLSLVETKWLLANPAAFIKDLFTHGYNTAGNIFSGDNTYWNDLKSNVIVKTMAVINFFTHSSYYTNILFFNFLFLFGLVALFKLFTSVFPHKKSLVIAGVFLLPSALFWCSGIHKDGLILSATGMLIYTYYTALANTFSPKKIIVILLCGLLLFSLRNYVLFALIPALLCWSLCIKFPGNNGKIFASIYIAAGALFFLIPLIFSSLNFPDFIIQKRHEFLLLEPGSQVSGQQLQPSFTGFISFLPAAVDMAFFRPHITELKSIVYAPAAIEVVLLILLFFISIITINKNQKIDAAIWFLLFFSMSVMLLSGYTIPFTGAIVRYRSFVLPLFVTPLLCISNIFSTPNH